MIHQYEVTSLHLLKMHPVMVYSFERSGLLLEK